jgi:hypothetical protein
MTPEENIIYKIQLLEELVESQERLLTSANTIINMKTRLVELCEQEIELYKRKNSRLQVTVFGLCIILLLNVIVHLISIITLVQ